MDLEFPIHYYASNEDYETLYSLLYNVECNSMNGLKLEDYQKSLLSMRDKFNRLPIHYASEVPTCSKIIRLLIELYPESATIKDPQNGNLPIHYYTSMITNDSILSIKILYNAYPNSIKEKDCNNELIIHDLIRHLDIDEVSDLFLLFVELYPSSILEKDCHGQYPIHMILENNSPLKVIEKLIKLVPSIITNKTEPYQNMLLHYYLKMGTNVKLDIIKCLIDMNKIQLTQKDWSCNLPLHLAFKCCTPEDVVITIIRYLINMNDIEFTKIIEEKDCDGNNSIMLSIKYGYSINVLKYLVNEKYNIPKMTRDFDNRNYFYLLAQYQPKNDESLEYLINYYRDYLNDVNIEGNTSLHAAAKNYQSSSIFIKKLLDGNSSMIKIKNNLGYLPIHNASSEPQILPEIIKIIGNSYPSGCLETVDGDLPLHIAVSKGANLEIIRNLLLISSSAASIKNKYGQYPLTLAIENKASLSVLVAILFAHPLKMEEFKGLISPVDDTNQKVLSFVISLLKERKQISTLHLHLCGNSFAGKTTFRNELRQTLGKSWVSYQMSSLFRSRKNISEVSRTIGMECDIFDDDKGRRWIVHDYGGQKEFHINHSRFLAVPGSVYIIVVALYDPVKNELLNEEEILSRYQYWIKYIYSISDTTPQCITLINFKRKCDELDKDLTKRIEQLLCNEQKNWLDSNIKFIGEPVILDVVNRDEVFNQVNNLILEAIATLSVNNFPVSVIINECLKRKFEWPRAITELQLIHEVIFPMLEEFIDFNEIPESFVDPLCSLLSQFIVHRMEKLGEITIVEGSNGVNWAITDPNWLSNRVLGQIFYPSTSLQSGTSIFNMQHVMPLSTEVMFERADIKKEFNFLVDHLDYLPALLEAIGVCIPIYDEQIPSSEEKYTMEYPKMWFPSFIDNNKTEKDCIPIANNRICIRRFRLADPSKQIFPPGFFSCLFVNIAGLERQSTHMKFFSDGMELIANYAYEPEPFTKHRSKIQIIVNRSTDYFDVIVTGVKVVGGDSYIWKRIEFIRSFIFQPSPSAWQKNVILKEYCVHPCDKTKEIPFHKTLQGLMNPESKEEMLSYYYGELDGVAVEELDGVTATSIFNEKQGMSLGLEEFYRKSTNSFKALHEVIHSQNMIINKLKDLHCEIETSMKTMNLLIDDSNIKAKTIIRDVVSLKNGLPDANRIDDDDFSTESHSMITNLNSNNVLLTNESADEIDRIESKAEQLITVSNSMKQLLRQLQNAYDESNELIVNSSKDMNLINSNISRRSVPCLVDHRQLVSNDENQLTAVLINKMTDLNNKVELVSENVDMILSSNNKISTTIQSMVARISDIPAFPLMLLDPPKGSDWRNPKKWGFRKSRLFFICPITLKVSEAGLKGKGYKIYEPKEWFVRVVPLLKISVLILQIAIRSMGVTFNIPFPDFPNSNEVYLSNLHDVLDEMMLVTSGNAVADEIGKVSTVLENISDTIDVSKELNEEAERKKLQISNLDKNDNNNNSNNNNSESKNILAIEVNDRVYAALAQLLKYAGDPMPNNRPIYSGLIGPICSRYDGTVSWIHESAVELFHQKGKAAFLMSIDT